ncbi:glycine D-amino acid oxidase [Secundilactobacillus odoratitofui DSM 19909 = JCM 15043]|uniref:Glycine D-amino acid oxidase n=1 Tax=Secundilactobacillus odoratitofui DSM 19909 = JCM 15043 TaxID=1423776 RepID=A0A0R1LXV7_9LACO|nr:FAD-dependent oxidoreductase [Secundilactobacillus odoratitofui]KRK98052.1 glycine D-amino acid oxidase [Secundilactobacillus odoratitofui DSM 19909 = JCM 15043]
MKRKIAIIGGGIVGASAAYYLSQLPGGDQLSVTLYDDGVGQATKAAAGIISPWLSKRRNQQWYQLAKDGATTLMTLARKANLSTDIYHQTGTIVTRTNEKDLKDLYELAQTRRHEAPDMGEVELLTAQEVQKRLPLLTNPQPGIFVSGGARIDGEAFISELLTQAQRVNLTVKQERVTLDATGNILASAGTQRFDNVILAAGAWLKDLIEPLGLTADVRPQKGQLIELIVPDYPTQENMPVLMPEGERDFIPFGHGKLIVGATHDDEGQFDLNITQEATDDLLKSAQHFDQSLTRDHLVQSKVGTRAYTPDFSPFFGRLTSHPHLLVASGLGASGLTTGPLIGRLLAGTLLYGGTPDWSNYEKNLSHYIH